MSMWVGIGLNRSISVCSSVYRYSHRSAISMVYYGINLRGLNRSGTVKDVFLEVYYRSYVSKLAWERAMVGLMRVGYGFNTGQQGDKSIDYYGNKVQVFTT